MIHRRGKVDLTFSGAPEADFEANSLKESEFDEEADIRRARGPDAGDSPARGKEIGFGSGGSGRPVGHALHAAAGRSARGRHHHGFRCTARSPRARPGGGGLRQCQADDACRQFAGRLHSAHRAHGARGRLLVIDGRPRFHAAGRAAACRRPCRFHRARAVAHPGHPRRAHQSRSEEHQGSRRLPLSHLAG